MGMIAMSYGSVYVAQVAMGANNLQTIKAMTEAEAYDGPSLIIAYSHCIAHGIDMSRGLQNQNMAVESGSWPLYRFDPTLGLQGKNPLQLDSKDPTIKVKDWAYSEGRFKMLTKTNPEAAAELMKQAQEDADAHWKLYQKMAE
jgi:pyruvate-ferredoxin/flavodoxin oxidoreductase